MGQNCCVSREESTRVYGASRKSNQQFKKEQRNYNNFLKGLFLAHKKKENIEDYIEKYRILYLPTLNINMTYNELLSSASFFSLEKADFISMRNLISFIESEFKKRKNCLKQMVFYNYSTLRRFYVLNNYDFDEAITNIRENISYRCEILPEIITNYQKIEDDCYFIFGLDFCNRICLGIKTTNLRIQSYDEEKFMKNCLAFVVVFIEEILTNTIRIVIDSSNNMEKDLKLIDQIINLNSRHYLEIIYDILLININSRKIQQHPGLLQRLQMQKYMKFLKCYDVDEINSLVKIIRIDSIPDTYGGLLTDSNHLAKVLGSSLNRISVKASIQNDWQNLNR